MLADADPRFLARVRDALVADAFEICAEVDDAPTAIDAARLERPDLVLLDLALPGNGLRAAVAMLRAEPGLAVVLLATEYGDADLVAALRVGVSGLLRKDSELDRLPHALRAVLAGEVVLPRTLVTRLVRELRIRRDPGRIRLTDTGAVRLTDREWDVMTMLRAGSTTRQVAQQMFISQVTVRTHVSAAVKKLGAPDRAAALRALEAMEAVDPSAPDPDLG